MSVKPIRQADRDRLWSEAETDLILRAARGHNAEQALTAIGEAVEVLNQANYRSFLAFRSSGTRDVDHYQLSVISLKGRLLEELKQHLSGVAQDGKTAAEELNTRGERK